MGEGGRGLESRGSSIGWVLNRGCGATEVRSVSDSFDHYDILLVGIHTPQFHLHWSHRGVLSIL